MRQTPCLLGKWTKPGEQLTLYQQHPMYVPPATLPTFLPGYEISSMEHKGLFYHTLLPPLLPGAGGGGSHKVGSWILVGSVLSAMVSPTSCGTPRMLGRRLFIESEPRGLRVSGWQCRLSLKAWVFSSEKMDNWCLRSQERQAKVTLEGIS